jgi:heme exporter protein C
MSVQMALHRTPSGEGESTRSRWERHASPQQLYPLAGRLMGWAWAISALLAAAGLSVGLLIAPADGQQGDADRIILVHLPAAGLSLLIYLSMAFWCALALMLNSRMASMMASALAPTGLLMTFIALWTGALWDKPTWGTWWVWDARLISELLLILLYIGFMALQSAIDDRRRMQRASTLLVLGGGLAVPATHFSDPWWSAPLHGASWSVTGMLLMTAAVWAWSFAAALHRVRSIILESERHADWVRQQLELRR